MEQILHPRDIDSLINELERKGQNHNYYYHYTTWESAKRIMEGQSFLLTRGNSLNINDQQEAITKGAWKVWNKTFIASFSFGSSENMAMWGLYGLPWEDAVRLCIPKREMLNWVASIDHVELWRDGHIHGDITHPNVVLTDLVYVDGIKGSNQLRLTHAQASRTIPNDPRLRDLDKDPRMTGYIKNYAWHYENEVRLKIRLPYDTGYEKIRVEIPRETLDAITITTGACFEWKDELLYIGLCNVGRVFDSGFKHLVKYRPLCSFCQHGQFQRIENHG